MAVKPEMFRLFLEGKITQEEMLGETPKISTTKAKVDRKKATKVEDSIQVLAINYLREHYPDIPTYGNATANIFFSGGMYRKSLPKSMYGVLSGLGIKATTWGYLLDHALSKLGLRLTVAQLEKDQEGAKFAQMKRTKALGAVASWPDIQVCFASNVPVMTDNGQMQSKWFNGLFLELKKPDASSLPWGKADTGRFTTNEHLQSQAATLSSLTKQGYLACFAVGFDQFKAITEIHFGTHTGKCYLQEQPITLADGTKGMIHRIRKAL